MGVFSSIFKYAVETAVSGNENTVYSVRFGGFYNNSRFPKFSECFDAGGNCEILIKQICSFGLMELFLSNERATFKDGWIDSIADRMNSFAAYIAECIQKGKRINGGVRNIVKFIELVYNGDTLERMTLQVEAESGHRITMKIGLPSGLIEINRYMLESSCSCIPGVQLRKIY